MHAELKGTGHIAKFLQAFYLQTLPNLTLPYLKPLPYNNLTTKPYKPLPPIWTLNSFLNSYIFVVCSIWCKTLFIAVVVVYKFCCTKSHSSPFFKSCHPSPYCCWSMVYSFIKRRNKPGFSGLIKIPIDMALNHHSKDPFLEHWGMWSTHSLPLLSGPLWSRVVVPIRDPCMGQIEPFECKKKVTDVKLNF